MAWWIKFQIQRLALLLLKWKCLSKRQKKARDASKKTSQAKSAVASKIPGIFRKQHRGQND